MIKFENLQKALDEYGKAIAQNYKFNLTESDRVATANLYNSIKHIVECNGTTYEISLNLENYWEFIEFGTKPHMPPVDKIYDWVVAKEILPQPMANGKLPTEKDLAWMIAKKIQKEGTEGKPDLENALDKLEQSWDEKIEEALDMDIMESIDDLFMLVR